MKNLWSSTMGKMLVVMLALAAMAMFVGCAERETTSSEDNMGDVSGDIATIGEGDVAFTFTVTFEDATMHIYQVNTDATSVGEALVEVGLIEGEDSEYGLFVSTVDGVTLDWEADAAYWAFYVNGDMASSGVDSTEVVEGSTYTFVYTE